jgi:hypothetical protein
MQRCDTQDGKAKLLFRWLVPNLPAHASEVVVPHSEFVSQGPQSRRDPYTENAGV